MKIRTQESPNEIRDKYLYSPFIDFINNKEQYPEESNYYRLHSDLIDIEDCFYTIIDSCDTLKELITKHINTKYAYCKIINKIVK